MPAYSSHWITTPVGCWGKRRQRRWGLIVLFLILGVAGGWAAAAELPVVRLTTGEWPPYVSEQLPHHGRLAQIITEALARQGYRVEYGFYPWPRAYELAKTGKWDGSIIWQPTPKRTRHFYFSQPIADSEKVFFHRKDFAFDWKTLEDLKGLRVGTTRGYVYTPSFRSDAKRIGIPLIDADSDRVNLALLLQGRVQLHPNDLHAGLYLIRRMLTAVEAGQLTHHSLAMSRTALTAIFPKKIPRSHQLVTHLNRGLATLSGEEKYRETLMAGQAGRTLRVAYAHWPPYKIADNDRIGGIDKEIITEIGLRTGLAFEYIVCPWKRCVEMARSGQVDLITSFGRTTDRETFMHYLGRPYRHENIAFYKKRGAAVHVATYEDLRRYKIGSVKGSSYFAQFDTDSRIKLIPVTIEHQLLRMLDAGRIDLMVGFETPVDYQIAIGGFSASIEKTTFRVTGQETNLAMPKKSNAQQHRPILDGVIRQMTRDGDINRITRDFIDQQRTAAPRQ